MESKPKTEEKPVECKHEKTYVAVRHISGISIVKCSSCNKVI